MADGIVTAVLVKASIKTLGDTTFCVVHFNQSYKPPHASKAQGWPDPPPSAASALSAPATRLPASLT